MPRQRYTIWDALEKLGIEDPPGGDDPFGDPGVRERMSETIARAVTNSLQGETAKPAVPATPAPEVPAPTSPFLLPLCTACGGVTRLARVHVQVGQEQRFYVCSACGAEHSTGPVNIPPPN